jgi:hypothetical protein
VWWLIPVIPAIKEADIKGKVVREQPGQKVSDICSSTVSVE